MPTHANPLQGRLPIAESGYPAHRFCLRRAAEKCACADLQRRFVLPKSVDFDGAVRSAARRGRPLPQRAHRDLPPYHDHHRDGHVLLRQRRRRPYLPSGACQFSAQARESWHSIRRSASPRLASTRRWTDRKSLQTGCQALALPDRLGTCAGTMRSTLRCRQGRRRALSTHRQQDEHGRHHELIRHRVQERAERARQLHLRTPRRVSRAPAALLRSALLY